MGMYREAIRKKFREVGDMIRKEQPKYLSHEELTQGIDRLTKIKERDNVIHVNFKPDRELH